MAESKFGDFYVGKYNVLPANTQKVPYTAPKSIFLSRVPAFDTSTQGIGTKPIDRGWDFQLSTKETVEKIFKLADAYTKLAELTKGHWGGRDFNSSDVSKVHENWGECPVGLYCSHIPEVYGGARQAVLLHALCTQKKRPSAFVGALAGVAPFLCATIPCQGPISKEYEDACDVSVTESTTEGWELGLEGKAGVDAKGAKIERTASLKWSKSTTKTSTVTKKHSEITKLTVPDKHWGRLDVRVAGGVYAGWLVYKTNEDNNNLAVYPMLVPIHCPNFVSPVAEHTMLAHENTITAAEAALMSRYNALQTEHDALSAALAEPDDDSRTADINRLLDAEAEMERLRAALQQLEA
ncbi:hypothetical protein DZF91_36390 [Actinomadura logoneensis]|uniref:Uncharacterized protein n=1 Tax=Actinomadura logoneensis TaxID=2293572 RepID=A0A372JAD3_9ACTN|nr:ETX/MTX2 family pore-forming toxin [Actinomadura logoneensis]RFU36776.1 hypothetical protein DZF91_36390 [Actinomadura logoneensis]